MQRSRDRRYRGDSRVVAVWVKNVRHGLAFLRGKVYRQLRQNSLHDTSKLTLVRSQNNGTIVVFYRADQWERFGPRFVSVRLAQSRQPVGIDKNGACP